MPRLAPASPESHAGRAALGALILALTFLPHLAGAIGFPGLVPGPPAYQQPPPTRELSPPDGQRPCPAPKTGWQYGRVVAGVELESSNQCRPDSPSVVAAVTKGTNRVPRKVLMPTGLAPGAVEKCCDRDGDGDPDKVTFRLEVAEINGRPPADEPPNLTFPIAPGVKPGFWVFVPKTRGMATEDSRAGRLVRMPSPTLRVEQGDEVRVVLENTHYFPHTIHFHGGDHPFRVDGQGNDGVPQVSETPVMPAERRTYRFRPRAAGSFFYHCHVQPNVHVLMGLGGLFVVEPAAAGNRVQSVNIGAGRVRHPSRPSRERFDREYDLVYQGVDPRLHGLIRESNDPRVVQEAMHRRYADGRRQPTQFLLNGRSFPYTVRESQIQVRTGERVRLRVLNAGSEQVDLHTHGHRATVLAYDGVPVDGPRRVTRDVFQIGASQRLDLLLHTRDDGRLASGPGVWFMHDHREKAVTTNGVAPGGDIGLITYESQLLGNGMPVRYGVDWAPYFSPDYYRGERPVWEAYSGPALGEVAAWEPTAGELAGLGLGGLALGAAGSLAAGAWRRRRRR